MFAFEARNVFKSYGGVQALSDAGIAVRPGTVHALLGENGAGKSTLVKIMTGAVKPDSGSISLRGESVTFETTVDAHNAGIAVVSQELSLFPHLTVIDNLFPMRELKVGPFVSRKKMLGAAKSVLEDLGFAPSPLTLVGDLTLGDRQLVEIAKALVSDPKVLLLDEPTSALEAHESERLIKILRVLKERQVAVIFISHILQEVMQVCDEVTVLRNGKLVIDGEPIEKHNLETLISAMIGDRQLKQPTSKSAEDQLSSDQSTFLLVQDANFSNIVKDVSFEAKPGEVLGLAGLAGSGPTEILKIIAGINSRASGQVTLPGGIAAPSGQRSRISAGVAYVSGDRRKYGLMLAKSVWENIVQVRTMGLATDGGWISKRKSISYAEDMISKIGIKASSPEITVGSLSGGNQQKVVFAKWLTTNPKVILLDDPTRGVDVYARSEIHQLLRQSAASGAVVVLCSTDVEEISVACDRVLVFYRGSIVANLKRENAQVETLLSIMNGE